MDCIAIQKCNGESETSRLSYIKRISLEFSEKRDYELELPSADEARSFDEALSHVVRLFPIKRDGDSTTPFSELKACKRRKASRKECLKEILDALRWMERKRLYDPPADDEIGFYLLIKKYVRAIFTSFSVRTGLGELMFGDNYGCSSLFCILSQVEELVELNRYFADFSAFVSELNIEDGSVIKPLMGIQDNYEVPPLIRGSEERSNKFYHHKFCVALSDIRTLESSIFRPFAEEERSYLRVLDHILSHPSAQTKDEVSVYSIELYELFVEKLGRDISDTARHCTSIRKYLLDKLSIQESWECLQEMYYQDEEESVELGRKLAEKCRVPHTIAIKKYLMSVERCRDIAHGVSLILHELSNEHYDDLVQPTYGVCPDIMSMFGWEALHVLTLLKHGSFSPGNIYREHIILRNSKNTNSRMELECCEIPGAHHREAKMGLKLCGQGSENENVKKKKKLKCKEVQLGQKRCAQGSENGNVKKKLKCKEAKMGLKCCGQGSKHEKVKMTLECKKDKIGQKRCAQVSENKNVKKKKKLKFTGVQMVLKRCAHGSESENVKKKLKCKEVHMELKRCARVSENENVKKKLKSKEAQMGLKRCAQISENDNVKKKKKLKSTGVQVGLKHCAQGSESENVRVLRGIVEDLRRIGDSDILPDKEEHTLMFKIWYSVASSVHFFLSATAYEQRRYVIQRGGSLDVRKVGASRTKRMKKSCIDAVELRKKTSQVVNTLEDVSCEMHQLMKILDAYGHGLREKLESEPTCV